MLDLLQRATQEQVTLMRSRASRLLDSTVALNVNVNVNQ